MDCMNIAFIQSALQFMPLINHSHMAIGCHARYQPAPQEQLGIRYLAQGHFDLPRVGSNRPDDSPYLLNHIARICICIFFVRHKRNHVAFVSPSMKEHCHNVVQMLYALSQLWNNKNYNIYFLWPNLRFRCGNCCKTWSSARVSTLFHYRLRRGTARGTVIMRPFGQACRSCSGTFELPGFSTAEVEKVLLKLIGKIKKNCYGEEEEDNGDSRFSRKVGMKPHESSLCEACQQGICCVED